MHLHKYHVGPFNSTCTFLSFHVHISWKLMTPIISTVTQAKILSVPLNLIYPFIPSHRILGRIHSVSYVFLQSVLSSVFHCQRLSSPSSFFSLSTAGLRNFHSSRKSSSKPCLYLCSPTQSSVTAAMDSSHILPGLPTTGFWDSAWGLSLTTEAHVALVWDTPQY